MRKIKKVNDIDIIKDALNGNINNFLRNQGWTYTCDTPGSYWLWSRIHQGRVIMVDTAHALGIQRALENER